MSMQLKINKHYALRIIVAYALSFYFCFNEHSRRLNGGCIIC